MIPVCKYHWNLVISRNWKLSDITINIIVFSLITLFPGKKRTVYWIPSALWLFSVTVAMDLCQSCAVDPLPTTYCSVLMMPQRRLPITLEICKASYFIPRNSATKGWTNVKKNGKKKERKEKQTKRLGKLGWGFTSQSRKLWNNILTLLRSWRKRQTNWRTSEEIPATTR